MGVNMQVGTWLVGGTMAMAMALDPHLAHAYVPDRTQAFPTVNIAPINALDRYQQGLSAVSTGDLIQAIVNFNRAIELDPRYFQAYIERGNVKDALQDLPGAIADFTTAIALNPKSAPAYYNRATVMSRSGRRQAAIADYDRAIAINPRYAQAYLNRGNELDDLGDTAGALKSYNAAISIRPNYALAFLNRGIAYGRAGNRPKAIADLQQAADLFKAGGNLDRYKRALKMIADLQAKKV
jgi:tetratricopeptide (TPR) repeat protein